MASALPTTVEESSTPEPARRLGGHLALDWLNTVVHAAEGPVDSLTSDQAVLDWLSQSGLPTARSKPPGPEVGRLAAQARRLREAVRELIAHRMLGTRKDPSVLNEFLEGGRGHWRLEWKSGRAQPERQFVRDKPGTRALLAPVAEAACEILAWQDFSTVKRCENPACTRLFFDPSATRRRRWCDMAVCGNRMKAAAFRERRRAE